ncbi:MULTISPECIES: phosphohydrolase [unclassified Burkholderia]|uniref:phosphohydrolase n=1 Tax=unclassified Burkholderia TaxID=2613784 RepID=UPI000F57CF7D|nr:MULTISPECIES: phosphohydrolase [unclassified Burkholderia]RQR40718.1 phosphohydrolase [Burkholderia sp. Bp9142]RQR45386.1 phosphohydrolase [Burkholderia sp. Bp9140]
MSSILNELAVLYTDAAQGRYGLTAVRQQEHALQAGALAEANNEPASLIAASFLHDAGHMIHDLGEDCAARGIDDTHEERGARWLAQYFGPAVTEPIRLHVAAKRYLCTVEQEYTQCLAPDSIRSLQLQGGLMSREEVEAFIGKPYAQEAIRVRRYDDLAKRPGVATPPVDHFLAQLKTLLENTDL